MLYWKDKLDFAERIVVGSAMAAGIIAISSYYLGLVGFNLKYHGIVLPLLMLGAAYVFTRRKLVA